MADSPGSVPPLDAARARERFRRVTAQVFAVQLVSLVALWLLGVFYGTP